MPENPPTSDNTGQQDHISGSAAGRPCFEHAGEGYHPNCPHCVPAGKTYFDTVREMSADPDLLRAVDRTEGKRSRYATTATAATFIWHYLSDRGNWRGIEALCGERHRQWQLVERFAVPDAFEPCQMCVAINEGMTPENA